MYHFDRQGQTNQNNQDLRWAKVLEDHAQDSSPTLWSNKTVAHPPNCLPRHTLILSSIYIIIDLQLVIILNLEQKLIYTSVFKKKQQLMWEWRRTRKIYPVSSLKGRSPENPGRVVIMDVEATMWEWRSTTMWEWRSTRRSACGNMVMMWLEFTKYKLALYS